MGQAQSQSGFSSGCEDCDTQSQKIAYGGDYNAGPGERNRGYLRGPGTYTDGKFPGRGIGGSPTDTGSGQRPGQGQTPGTFTQYGQRQIPPGKYNEDRQHPGQQNVGRTGQDVYPIDNQGQKPGTSIHDGQGVIPGGQGLGDNTYIDGGRGQKTGGLPESGQTQRPSTYIPGGPGQIPEINLEGGHRPGLKGSQVQVPGTYNQAQIPGIYGPDGQVQRPRTYTPDRQIQIPQGIYYEDGQDQIPKTYGKGIVVPGRNRPDLNLSPYRSQPNDEDIYPIVNRGQKPGTPIHDRQGVIPDEQGPGVDTYIDGGRGQKIGGLPESGQTKRPSPYIPGGPGQISGINFEGGHRPGQKDSQAQVPGTYDQAQRPGFYGPNGQVQRPGTYGKGGQGQIPFDYTEGEQGQRPGIHTDRSQVLQSGIGNKGEQGQRPGIYKPGGGRYGGENGEPSGKYGPKDQFLGPHTQDGQGQRPGAYVQGQDQLPRQYTDDRRGPRPGTYNQDGQGQRPGVHSQYGQGQRPGTYPEDGQGQRPGSFTQDGQVKRPGIYTQDGQGQRTGTYTQYGQGQRPGSFTQDGQDQRPGTFIQDGQGQRMVPLAPDGLGQRPGTYTQDGQGQRPGSFAQDFDQRPGSHAQDGQRQRPGTYVQGGQDTGPGEYIHEGQGQNQGVYSQDGQGQRPGSYTQDGLGQRPGTNVEDELGHRPGTYVQGGQVQRPGTHVQGGQDQIHGTYRPGEPGPHSQDSQGQRTGTYGQDRQSHRPGPYTQDGQAQRPGTYALDGQRQRPGPYTQGGQPQWPGTYAPDGQSHTPGEYIQGGQGHIPGTNIHDGQAQRPGTYTQERQGQRPGTYTDGQGIRPGEYSQSGQDFSKGGYDQSHPFGVTTPEADIHDTWRGQYPGRQPSNQGYPPETPKIPIGPVGQTAYSPYDRVSGIQDGYYRGPSSGGYGTRLDKYAPGYSNKGNLDTQYESQKGGYPIGPGEHEQIPGSSQQLRPVSSSDGRQYPHNTDTYPTQTGEGNYPGQPDSHPQIPQTYIPGTSTGTGYGKGINAYDKPSDGYRPRSDGYPGSSDSSRYADNFLPYTDTGYPTNTGDKSQQGQEIPENDDANSQAETSIQQIQNGTQASASSVGTHGGGTAQSQITGSYTGSGSFSAQAQTIDANRGAQSQISVGKDGATSNAQGKAGRGQSQAQLQLASETGATVAEAQSGGWNHGTNTQVQASSQGGLADAQANGPGSTSSQAQIGFQPHKEGVVEDDKSDSPFYGGGTASAQSGNYAGQSQTQIQGKFKYGISYNGAAQAGSGVKDLLSKNRTSMKPFDAFAPKTIRTDRQTSQLDFKENEEKTPIEKPVTEVMEESETKNLDRTHVNRDASHINHGAGNINHDASHINHGASYNNHGASHINHGLSHNLINTTENTLLPSSKNDMIDVDDIDAKDTQNIEDYEDLEEDEYDSDFYQSTEATHQSIKVINQPKNVFQQTGHSQKQHILLGSLDKSGIRIVKDSTSNTLKEGMTFQPGEIIPGTQGYTIPIGFRGRVSSVSQGEDTFAFADENGESQAQSITLTPGTGNITYTKPAQSPQPTVKNINSQNSRSLLIPERPRNNLNSKRRKDQDSYVTVTKTVAGELNADQSDLLEDKKFSHTYYSKSSTCGYFTFTCNIVYGSNGRTKICKPNNIPKNPDGSPVQC